MYITQKLEYDFGLKSAFIVRLIEITEFLLRLRIQFRSIFNAAFIEWFPNLDFRLASGFYVFVPI